jgi:MFS family permease
MSSYPSTLSSPSHLADPDTPAPIPHSYTDSSPTIYPEGGTRAWLVVLGAWCGLSASIGLYNTTGVLSIVISSSVLTDSSPSSLGWIFSIYAFVVWSVGVWVGPCFDVFGPRMLLLAGTCCTVLGMMGLSFCSGELFDSLPSSFLWLDVCMGKSVLIEKS